MRATFGQCATRLMDTWISAGSAMDDPSVICTSVIEMLRPDMVMTITDTSAAEPLDWTIRFVHLYGIPSAFSDLLALQQDQPLRSLPDRQFALDMLVSGRQRVIGRKRPEIDSFDKAFLGIRIGGERIILPQRNATLSAGWCVVLARIHHVLPLQSKSPDLDDMSLGILQLLREGFTAKEIGLRMRISSRTVEHRLARLKSEFGARSVAHLVTLSIATGRPSV